MSTTLKILGLALLVSIPLKVIASPRIYGITPVVSAQATPVVSNVWTGYALLKRIASCESWGDPNKEPRQFKDGQVLRGVPNPDDIGLAQINEPTWGAQAKELGYDIYTYDGNLAMAKWIFNHYGSTPWNWSKGCWGK